MKTDALIRALAADKQIERPVGGLLLARLFFAIAIAVVALGLILGYRDDLLPSLGSPLSVMRFALTAALGVIGLRIALLLARPEGRGLTRLWPLAAVPAMALCLVIWAYFATPEEGRQMALVGKTMVNCLITIPVLSILPVAAIISSLRGGATTVPALAGFVAGASGGGFGAMVYALHCTEDSPLFYLTWYGLAILGVTLVSTLVGARTLRW